MTRPKILDNENVALLDLTPSSREKPAWAIAADKEVCRQMASLTASVMRRAGDDDTTAWDDVRKYVEGLEEKVAFTMTDTSRMLRKPDIEDVCPHPDDCFYESERVRCGPCAVKASKLAGIEIDDTHSHLPEVCRLRREVKAAEARIAELEKHLADAERVIERLRLSLSEAIAERDAAFEMSKCECGTDEACRNLVEARATGRREGMEAIIAIAEDYANDAMPGSGYRLACVDIAAAIRAATEKAE